MTLFRIKNVFFIAHTLFFNDIDYYFRTLEYVDLKSEISEVSAVCTFKYFFFKGI